MFIKTPTQDQLDKMICMHNDYGNSSGNHGMKISFAGADVSGLIIKELTTGLGTNGPSVDFRGAICRGTIFHDCICDNINFNGADLSGAIFTTTNRIADMDVIGANLAGTLVPKDEYVVDFMLGINSDKMLYINIDELNND